jgi:CRISPR-associated protein (TIGR02584 family)
MPRTLIVTRHPAIVRFAEAHGFSGEVVSQLDDAIIESLGSKDRVLGPLPLSRVARLCAKGVRYYGVELDTPPELRGRELSLEEMHAFGARVQRYLAYSAPAEDVEPPAPLTRSRPDRSRQWRTVLIVSGGLSPQVVTETVFALATRAEDPCIPDRLICVVTNSVAARFEAELPGALGRLALEWGLDPRWGEPVIRVPLDRDGASVGDVRSYEDAVAYGDDINNLVREETLDANARVHVSIAGGRKSMSYHAGAAIGMWGRPQDELSHVLVGVAPEARARDSSVKPEDFEQSPEFWFPTRKSSMIAGRGGRQIDAATATIELALVPFVPLRELLPKSVVAQPIDHAKLVAHLRAALNDRLLLRLIPKSRQVRFGQLAAFTLPPVHFALYQLMAEWARDKVEGAGPDGVGSGHYGWLSYRMFRDPASVQGPNPLERFFQIYDERVHFSGKMDEIRQRLTLLPSNRKQRQENVEYFQERLSALRTTLAAEVPNPILLSRIGGRPLVPGARGRFGLAVTADEIVIDE